MIVVRSPLRITLGGGGTDLPVWYKKNNSFLGLNTDDNCEFSKDLKTSRLIL